VCVSRLTFVRNDLRP